MVFHKKAEKWRRMLVGDVPSILLQKNATEESIKVQVRDAGSNFCKASPKQLVKGENRDIYSSGWPGRSVQCILGEEIVSGWMYEAWGNIFRENVLDMMFQKGCSKNIVPKRMF